MKAKPALPERVRSMEGLGVSGAIARRECLLALYAELAISRLLAFGRDSVLARARLRPARHFIKTGCVFVHRARNTLLVCPLFPNFEK